MKPILLILTGGTICSFGDSENANRDVNMGEAKRLILENFEKSSSPYRDTKFEVNYILDTLSENMTAVRWNILLEYLRTVDFDRYQGVIMAHGTDTLAYTSSFMSLIMSGRDIPVCIVSSQLPLDVNGANGNKNFSMAVELIRQGIPAGVYVPYENMNGKMYIHKGCHLMQCENYLDDFYSYDAFLVNEREAEEYVKNVKNNGIPAAGQGYREALSSISEISGCVLYIKPYVGLDYSVYNIDNGIKAVVHGLYHSCTACVERQNKEQEYTSASILYLLDKCRSRNIPVIAEPCREDINMYASGNDMTEAGAVPVYGMTSEMVYVKTLAGCAMELNGDRLTEFLRTDICGEMLWK